MCEYSKVVSQYDRLRTAATSTNYSGLIQNYSENSFVKKTLQLIEYAVAEKDIESSKKIQRAALKIVSDYRLRDAI